MKAILKAEMKLYCSDYEGLSLFWGFIYTKPKIYYSFLTKY